MVVAIDDLDAMVEATVGLIADPARRHAMAQAARRRCVEQFSMETVIDRWRTAFLPLLASSA